MPRANQIAACKKALKILAGAGITPGEGKAQRGAMHLDEFVKTCEYIDNFHRALAGEK